MVIGLYCFFLLAHANQWRRKIFFKSTRNILYSTLHCLLFTLIVLKNVSCGFGPPGPRKQFWKHAFECVSFSWSRFSLFEYHFNGTKFCKYLDQYHTLGRFFSSKFDFFFLHFGIYKYFDSKNNNLELFCLRVSYFTVLNRSPSLLIVVL